MGNSTYINKKLENNLHGCIITEANRNNIQRYIYHHLKKEQKRSNNDTNHRYLKKQR